MIIYKCWNCKSKLGETRGKGLTKIYHIFGYCCFEELKSSEEKQNEL